MQYDIALWSLHHSKLYFSGSYACFMYSILLLPVYSLFKCFSARMLAICVQFCSCLCKVCSRVSEPLTRFADFAYLFRH